MSSSPSAALVTVIIPAHNEAARIGATIRAVLDQATEPVEVIVADDGSRDATGATASEAGAQVITLRPGGNPGAARNAAALVARGSIFLFLDADCVPRPGWLAAHRQAHAGGHRVVGGALALPAGLSWTARADYFVSAYHVHPGRKAGVVPNHSPANLSVASAVFKETSGFAEQLPVADGHEELAWQSEASDRGSPIWFEPMAVAEHWNRGGVGNILRRSWRWGYSAVEAKATTRSSRLAAWYRFPLIGIVLAYPLALLETGYITGAWLGAGRWAVFQFIPIILISRLVYATALMAGATRWMFRERSAPGRAPRWR